MSDKLLVHIHIPKTAGTSIKNTNLINFNGNCTYFDFIKEIEKGIFPGYTRDNFFIFSFVRNPLDRLISGFKMRGNNDNDFKDFVFNGFDLSDILYKPQHEFITDGNNILVDFLGKYENLDKDWEKILDINNLDKTVLKIGNPGNHRPYLEYYDQEIIDRVKEIYAKDFELFGYE